MAHARKCFSIFPLRLLFCPCIRATLRPINTFLPSKYKSSFRLVPAFYLWMPFYLFLSTLLLSCETEISHERIFFILNTIMRKIYDLPIRHQYISIISLNPKEKFFIKQWKVWTFSNFNFQESLKNDIFWRTHHHFFTHP